MTRLAERTRYSTKGNFLGSWYLSLQRVYRQIRARAETQGESSLGLLDRIRQDNVRRAARNHLHGMDNHMLKDIGIARSDIDRLT